MNFSKVFYRLINLVRSPNSEWDNIKSENLVIKEVFTSYLLPLLLVGCFLKLTGRFLYLTNYNATHAIFAGISYFIISVSVIYASAWIVNEILPKFKCEKQYKNVFKLIAFSSLPSILLIGISSIHPDLTFINLFSLYSVVIFWLGVPKLLQISNEFKTGFVLISLLLITIITVILSFILMSVIFSILLL